MPLRLDGHVHLVGNGRAGSGCWIRLSGWHRLMGAMMSRGLGMPVGIDHPEFDETFIATLAAWLAESDLDGALLLAQDQVYQADGSPCDFGSFHVPNDHLFDVCDRHPAFLPAVSIHPARRDALDELDRCLARGARALKLLPNCHDVDCSAPRYDAFWERMSEARLPLLAHTGGELTVPVANRAYQSPEVLRRPLEIGLTVIAAHCASSSAVFDRDYFSLLEEMMASFPNLHADSSALNTPFRSRIYPRVLASRFLPRIVHGSDFPVPVGAWCPRLRGVISASDRREAAASANPLQRDYLLKRAAGFDEAHFTTLTGILRPWPAPSEPKEPA